MHKVNIMKKQRGFAVLLSSVVLMLIISIGAFIGAKGSLLEQQTANAMYRTEEAFENAEAGIRLMLATLKATPSLAASNQSLGGVALPYTASYNATTATITSTGAGSGNATRTITQRITLTPGTGGGPAAMTALGSISLGGSASATDVKAGGTFTGNSTYKDANNNTKSTAITQNATEFQITILDHNDNVLADSSGKPITRSMTTDEYFMYFFSGLCPTAKTSNNAAGCKSETKITITNNSEKGYICNSNCATREEDDKITAAYDGGKRIFWLDSGGIDHAINMGNENDPVLIFVMNIENGSTAAKINANSTIYGILYVDIKDQQLNLTCSCRADAKIISISEANDWSRPSLFGDWNYTRYSSAGVQGRDNKYPNICYGTGSPKKCSQTFSDPVYGSAYTTTVTTLDGNYLVQSATHPVLTYEKISTKNWGELSNLRLNSGAAPICDIEDCAAAKDTAALTCTGGDAVGDTGSCSFPATAVSGSNDTPVQIEVVGTWEGSGTGNSVIQGAAITSGNYSGNGDVSFIKNSTAITNAVLGGIGGSAFQSVPPTVSKAPNGWSDLN